MMFLYCTYAFTTARTERLKSKYPPASSLCPSQSLIHQPQKPHSPNVAVRSHTAHCPPTGLPSFAEKTAFDLLNTNRMGLLQCAPCGRATDIES
jgi:hypothetical protein